MKDSEQRTGAAGTIPDDAPAADDIEPTAEDLAELEADEPGIDIDAIVAERDSYLDQFTRARADYQNLRRRVEQEQSTARQQAARDILLQLLPVVDDFDRAVSSAPTTDEQQTWVSGTRMVGKKLMSVLERYGVKRYESVGKPFDPRQHEAVATEGDGTHVIEAYQNGYLLGDQVLRPAMVRTGDAPAPAPDGDAPAAQA